MKISGIIEVKTRKGRCKMKKSMIAVMALILCLAVNSFAAPQGGNKSGHNLIQIALLLDTSNSMDGLINQAKTQLWTIVNELALAKRYGESPRLQVALYEYGNNSLAASGGYVRRVVPLSTDLDRISEELFNLTTNGGSEYCGRVIEAAASGLEWHLGEDVMKIIIIAGNEPFTQGNVDYRRSCREAVARGIVINTIFCGNYQQGIQTNWKDGADLADGSYANIDQDRQIAHIDAPQDREIIALGQELNETYIEYGQAGKKNKERQERMDKLAAAEAPTVHVERSVAKSSLQYRNEYWDLVDAVKKDPRIMDKMEDQDLPPEMKGMDDRERREYVVGMGKKREELQERINRLNAERRRYLEEKMKDMSGENTLDRAIIEAVRRQAAEKDYRFE